ncbi:MULTISPECIES: macro domain-containing protein [unclassified Crossiella]|uniref:type II toxin-antitoxin system antitoxin DNA ADP-ribosyl glycohydrolase DarG n=1 Tax=unclassified Crossiella TaxID=2620835 RepID=UPI001FFEDB82|nr:MULTISPECIES: macro domain-containing protein [unclassified Crossiella]MCK2236251.1 macro domain-containing protein [Crossiella sp. S99.2]MCK2249918.1 macro domain-containing protein [Crossiella sp. S99.1]
MLKQDVEAMVNPVNCVGVLGKGLALQFKRAFPEIVRPYEEACRSGDLRPGTVHVVDLGEGNTPRWILNVPTKRHWRQPSRLDDVESGTAELAAIVQRLGIRSIAVPPLGCGNGGLPWESVRVILLRYLGDLTEVQVSIFSPEGAPPPEEMLNRTSAPELDGDAASLLALLAEFLRRSAPFRVEERSDTLARIEIQKLSYFAQVRGGLIEKRFDRGHYGPYSHELERQLRSWEGHFLLGYGDGTDKVLELRPIRLLAEAVRTADELVGEEQREPMCDVLDLVEGWENTYELELLATTLFVHEEGTAADPATAHVVIDGWKKTPERLFTARHIRLAWEHLVGMGWIGARSPINA